VGRRMMNAGIANGWAAWHELWAAKTYALRRLREVGNKLQTPELSNALEFWRADLAEEQRLATMTAQQKVEEELRMQLATTRGDYEARLSAAEESKVWALERLRVELTGSAEEMAALREEKAKEERIKLLKRQVGRRMMNQGIASGWAAWYELWAAKTYAMKTLREVGARLKAPELSRAFEFWTTDQVETKRAENEARLERESKSMEAQLRRARFEAGQLDMLRLAHEDELRSLKTRLDTMVAEAAEKEAAFAASLGAGKGIDDLKAALEAAKLATETAERLRVEAEEDVARQRKANQELLAKLLAAQRQSFEDEKRQQREQMGRGAEHYKEFEAKMQKDLADARAKVRSLEEWVASKTEEDVRRDREAEEASAEKERLEAELSAAREDRATWQQDVFAAREDNIRLEHELAELRRQLAAKAAEKAKLSLPGNRKKKEGGTSVLGNIDLDESDNALPINQQIALSLKANAGRVMDLLREWDTNGDGEVDRKEFHKAMPLLGFEAPKAEIDALFDEWDTDGGGTLSFKELQRILKAPKVEAAKPALKAVAAVSKLKALKPGKK